MLHQCTTSYFVPTDTKKTILHQKLHRINVAKEEPLQSYRYTDPIHGGTVLQQGDNPVHLTQLLAAVGKSGRESKYIHMFMF